MTETILLNIKKGIAHITLNRPDRLNAFDAPMAELWGEVCKEATQASEVKAIIVAAEGRAFCAGGDVHWMTGTLDRKRDLRNFALRLNSGIISLVESAKPVVVAAQGAIAGGGLGILLASDYAIIGKNAKLGSLYAGIGLTPDLSVSAQLARAVGERRALQLVLQERMLSATEAIEWGLAAEKVSDNQVLTRARMIAEQWAQNAHAYGEAKRLIRSQPTRTFREQLVEEARTVGLAAVTPESNKRLKAFAAR